MSETVAVPGMGRVKQTYAVAGVAVVAGVLGYAYWRRARSAPASTAVVDPNATGVTDYTPPASNNSGGSFNDSGVITTNDEWSAKATEALSGAFDQAFIQVTLGKYLSHQPLTDAEVDLIGAARAAAGDPPQGGPYSIVHVTGSGSTPPLGGPATQPTTTHTVVAGETMHSIVQEWTAEHNQGLTPPPSQVAANMRTIYDYNSYLHGREVQPGDLIILPAFDAGYY